jgi:arsenate reductase
VTRNPLKILVLCTGNSARSILGEVLINELGAGRFEAYSAGSQPAGVVNPGAIEKLEREGHDVTGLASKSWEAFSGADAPQFDIVITVCDNAAGESCPVWNGSPVTVHWGIADPAAASPGERKAAFDTAYDQLRERIVCVLELPLEEFDARMRRESLQRIHDALAAGEETDE